MLRCFVVLLPFDNLAEKKKDLHYNCSCCKVILVYVYLLSLTRRCNECIVQKPASFMGHMSMGNVVSSGSFC